jgi:uncharacterized membrane protein
MIALPELLIVLGIFAMMGGYVALIHHMLSHADRTPDSHPNRTKPNKS